MENLFSINSRETLFRAVLGLSLLISIFLSYFLVSKNYVFLFFLIGLALSLFIMKSRTIPVIIILSISPFTGWAVEKGFLAYQILWFPELLSALLFLKVLVKRLLTKQKFQTPGLKFVFGFVLISFISLIYNHQSLIPALLMLRIIFRFYLLFLAVINLDLDEKAMKLVNSSLIIIFLLQLPLAIVKLFVYGQGEEPLGLSAHSYSMIIPLIAISFLYAFYFLYKRKAVYLLGILSFVGFSFIGGKRAFIFYFIVLAVFLMWFLRKQIRLNLRAIFIGVMLGCISFYFAGRLLPRFNPQNKVWGEFSIKHMIDFAKEYETGSTQAGISTGRITTSVSVLNQLSKSGFVHLAFGFGPGGIMQSRYEDYNREVALRRSYGIQYGDNGLSWLSLQVGCLGTLIFFLFLYSCLKDSYLYIQLESDPYWKSFASGMAGFAFIYLVTSLLYMPFFYTDVVSAFYFCLAAIFIIRKETLESKIQWNSQLRTT